MSWWVALLLFAGVPVSVFIAAGAMGWLERWFQDWQDRKMKRKR